jgi:hypothetical protein
MEYVTAFGLGCATIVSLADRTPSAARSGSLLSPIADSLKRLESSSVLHSVTVGIRLGGHDDLLRCADIRPRMRPLADRIQVAGTPETGAQDCIAYDDRTSLLPWNSHCLDL